MYDGKYADYPNLFHPLGMSGLSHPQITYSFTDEPDADAWFFHTVPIDAGRPRLVFHIEEIRSMAALMAPWLDAFPPLAVDAHIRRLLESESYKAIVTHLNLTAEGLKTYYRSDAISSKIRKVTLGIAEKPDKVAVDRPFTLVFTNSYHHNPGNLVRRGYGELLLAFKALRRAVPDARLVVYARGFNPSLHEDGITFLSRSLDDDEVDALYEAADASVLWAVDLHSHTTLRSVAAGCVTIVSDAPGYSELIEDGVTGLIVPGRYGRDCYFHERGRTISRRNVTDINVEAAERIAEVLIGLARDRDTALSFGRRAQQIIRAERPLSFWQGDLGQVFLDVAADA